MTDADLGYRLRQIAHDIGRLSAADRDTHLDDTAALKRRLLDEAKSVDRAARPIVAPLAVSRGKAKTIRFAHGRRA